MSKVREFISKFRKQRPVDPPLIMSAWGPVTESARRQAALNMRDDPDKRAAVEEVLAKQLFNGDIELGRAESRKRYPEAYQEAQ